LRSYCPFTRHSLFYLLLETPLFNTRHASPLQRWKTRLFPSSNYYSIPTTAPINPTNTPPSTRPNRLTFAPSLTCTGDGLPELLAVGVGPVFPGVVTVTSVTVCLPPPPGRTHEHEVLVGHVEGPLVPVHVVVWPVQVTEAGQLEMVMMVVEVLVMVELG